MRAISKFVSHTNSNSLFDRNRQVFPLMTVVQDVPVRILTTHQVEALVEPVPDHPTVQLMSPSLKILSNIVERLKSLDEK